MELCTGARCSEAPLWSTGGVPEKQMVDRLERLAARQGALVAHRQVLSSGLTIAQLRTLLTRGRWQRLTVGVFRTPAVTGLDPLDEARVRAAWTGLLALPGAAAVGMAALALHGVQGLPQRIPAEVCLPGGDSRTGPAGVTVRRYRGRLPVHRLHGFPVVTVPVALAQALPRLPRVHGVAVLDSALNQRLLRPQGLHEVEQLLRGRRGARHARRCLALADGRAESPLETRARLCFVDAGHPPTELQVIFRDRTGRVVARGDLGWRRADGSWVIAELDGREVHARPEPLYLDRSRQNLLQTRAGVTMLRFTGDDLSNGVAVRTLRDALARPAARVA